MFNKHQYVSLAGLVLSHFVSIRRACWKIGVGFPCRSFSSGSRVRFKPFVLAAMDAVEETRKLKLPALPSDLEYSSVKAKSFALNMFSLL
ncbi:hypothetical protein Mapa_009781 [Marchantia paleacea]|nr:hypothetical protein Mapa_009781 [Marchantia paleacea]